MMVCQNDKESGIDGVLIFIATIRKRKGRKGERG